MLTLATLSVHKFVNSVGAAVGFASIIAVAILILLYFAHAHETATLRDRLDEAQARIGGLEARVAQLINAQAAAQRGRGPAPVTPPPVTPPPARPMGSAVASVRRVPSSAAAPVAGAAGAAALMAASKAAASNQLPAAPAGMAGPALASATKLIPDPIGRNSGSAPDDTLFVPGAAVTAAANGSDKPAPKPQPAPAPAVATAAAATAAAAAAAATATAAEQKTSTKPEASTTPAAQAPPTPAGATQALPAVAVAAASARTPSARPRDSGGAPPRVQIGSDTAAAGAAPRRAQPRPPEPFLPAEDDRRHRRLSGRLLPLLIGGIAIAVIIVGLIVINNNSGSTTANVNHDNSNQTGQNVSNHQHKPVPFKPSKYRVAVLNGTAVSGLAGDVSTKLAGDGFKKGTATNAASQTYGSTAVYYVPGQDAAANRAAAKQVAKKLNLPDSRVQSATPKAIKSCSINAAGTSLGSCDGDVIVLVGSDRAGLASSGSSG